MSTIKAQLNQAVKDAMRAKEKARLTTLRMATAAIKQIEIDEKIEVDDTRTLAVLDKLIKQRKDAATQYKDAGREDLMQQELDEQVILQEFMPQALSKEEVSSLIDAAIAESGAESMKDMGKVMAILKPQIQGRADMGKVSGTVKAKLG
ncbi:MAG: GatB/YqeY domain-containing protein [Pseudomonadales bacterium]|nr:GatB/YqeY domain-containing protein [Pseudomonadales bacterium]